MLNSLPPVRGLKRWHEVQAILLRYGFDVLLDKEQIAEARQFLLDHFHLKVGEFVELSAPERLRLMLQELGPTYVKLGQILSSRSDLLPAEWVKELAVLQDAVPPFAFDQVQKIIEAELGGPLDTFYASFDPIPIAAASIGQVHRATLPDGSCVVVKVQRPNIQGQVKADLQILREIARLFESRVALGRQLGIVGIVDEFARSLGEEMDYRNEASNADRLRYTMRSIKKVHVPEIDWQRVTARVLTMEAVEGVKINEISRLDEAGIDRQDLADVFITSIFKQLMIDGFFHADPHPGNVFVNLEQEQIIYLDLGMMGTLISEQRDLLGDMIAAALRRDSREIVSLVMQIGTPYQKVNESSMRRAVDRILNRYLDASLGSISFSDLLNEMLTVVFQHGIRLPSEFSLALKTLMQGEQVARNLDPQIQMSHILQNIASQLFWQKVNWDALWGGLSGLKREAVHLGRLTPRALETVLSQLAKGGLHLTIDVPLLKANIRQMSAVANKLVAGLVLTGMIVGSAITMGISPDHSWSFIPILGVVCFVLSMTAGGLLVWSVLSELWKIGRRKDDD